MKIKIQQCGESEDHKFGDGKLSIRHYPASMGDIQATGEGRIILSGKEMKKAFVYCLTGWKNFIDEDTKAEIKLTDELKGKLFDFRKAFADLTHEEEHIVDFVLRHAGARADRTEQQRGN